MDPLARPRLDFDEYLAIEETAGVKHEYFDGVAWAMVGGSPRHAAMAATLAHLLRQAIGDHPCQVFSADLRIRVLATGLATYPDVSVVCNQLALDPEDPRGHTVTNPTLIVEVLSPSTESYDRGDKLAHYQQIPSLREVLLVAHDEPRLDLWSRTETNWSQQSARAGQEIVLGGLHDVRLAVDDVYFDPLGSAHGR